MAEGAPRGHHLARRRSHRAGGRRDRRRRGPGLGQRRPRRRSGARRPGRRGGRPGRHPGHQHRRPAGRPRSAELHHRAVGAGPPDAGARPDDAAQAGAAGDARARLGPGRRHRLDDGPRADLGDDPLQRRALGAARRLQDTGARGSRDGVTINSLLTGSIATERLASLAGSMENAEAGAAATVPAGRIGRPEEMAWAAAFLPRIARPTSPARRLPSTAARCTASDPRRSAARATPRMRGVTGYRRAFAGNGKPRQRSSKAGALDRSQRVAVGVAAAEQPGPQRVDAVAASARSPAGGSARARRSAARRRGAGRGETRRAPRPGRAPSTAPRTRPRRRPSRARARARRRPRHRPGPGRARAAAFSAWVRRYGSGSTAITSVDARPDSAGSSCRCRGRPPPRARSRRRAARCAGRARPCPGRARRSGERTARTEGSGCPGASPTLPALGG